MQHLNTVIFLALFTLISLSLIHGDVEIDSGDVVNTHLDIQLSLQVNILNNASKTIDLYWTALPDEYEEFMVKLEPSQSLDVSTTIGHHFISKYDNGVIVPPGLITIRKNIFKYYFNDHSEYLNKKVVPINQISQAIGVRFKSLAASVDIWYESGKPGGTFQGTIKLGEESTSITFVGKHFFFTETNHKTRVLARYEIKFDQNLYIIEDRDFQPPRDIYDSTMKEIEFMNEYKERNGFPWCHYHGPNGPRVSPVLHMWSAPTIGHIHSIETNHTRWLCDSETVNCREQGPIRLSLEVISTEPKVFLIENFLSDHEADTIISLAAESLVQSAVGRVGSESFSSLRTSKNAWVFQDSNSITETVFNRAADLLKINITYLSRNTEDLQVVKYQVGQFYSPHYDFSIRGKGESRYFTLLLYLSNQKDPNNGGETSFPKANTFNTNQSRHSGTGFKIHPGKGNAVLFYNLLEDGNCDQLTLHASNPVVKGEKWLANMWGWEPKKRY